jgi:hypothetical protein
VSTLVAFTDRANDRFRSSYQYHLLCSTKRVRPGLVGGEWPSQSSLSKIHDSTNKQNRMQESLVLFESVINSRWFLRTSVILFLNKIDVFKQKLPKVPLVHYFPEYTGGSDINKAAKYILWRFTQTNRARLSVYPHLTQATDTSNVRPFHSPSPSFPPWTPLKRRC